MPCSMPADSAITALLQFKRGQDSRIGTERIRLLEAIGEHGSISAGAKSAGLSYKGAWDAVQTLNNLFARPLVEARPGGKAGGAAVVTPTGHALVAAFRRTEAELAEVADRMERSLAEGEPPLGELLWSLGMKTSARNALRGTVVEVKQGSVNCEVRLKLSELTEIVAIVTAESARELELAPGREAVALINSSFVILAGAAPVATSARNRLEGVVIRHERGAVNDDVVLEIDQGKTIAATITRESADALGLEIGARAQALIKASHVILAVI